MRTCELPDCNNRHEAYGYCVKHYRRWQKHGDPYYDYYNLPPRLCKVSDCNTKHVGHGYCEKHLDRWKKYGDPNVTLKVNRDPICTIPNCNRKHSGMGYCKRHYTRWLIHGDPNVILRSPTKKFYTKSELKSIKVPLKKHCTIPDCNGIQVSKGWCDKHYTRWKRHGDPYAFHAVLKENCLVPDCNNKHNAKGYCPKHYSRWKAHGDPDIVVTDRDHLKEKETYVYRFYDINSNLLYIGIAYDIEQRFTQHAKDKDWWPDVHKMYVRKYPNRFEAARIEEQAIKKYNPKYNEIYNK